MEPTASRGFPMPDTIRLSKDGFTYHNDERTEEHHSLNGAAEYGNLYNRDGFPRKIYFISRQRKTHDLSRWQKLLIALGMFALGTAVIFATVRLVEAVARLL